MIDFDKSTMTVNAIDDQYHALCRGESYDLAEGLLRRGLKLYPDAPRLLVNMGMILRSRKAVHEALPYFAQAWKADKSNIRNTMHYGHTLTLCGRYYEAQAVYILADDELHHDVKLFTALGDNYQKAGEARRGNINLEYAATCFGHAATLQDGDLYAQKRHDEVKEYYGFCYSEESWEKLVLHMEKVREEVLDEDFSMANHPFGQREI